MKKEKGEVSVTYLLGVCLVFVSEKSVVDPQNGQFCIAI